MSCNSSGSESSAQSQKIVTAIGVLQYFPHLFPMFLSSLLSCLLSALSFSLLVLVSTYTPAISLLIISLAYQHRLFSHSNTAAAALRQSAASHWMVFRVDLCSVFTLVCFPVLQESCSLACQLIPAILSPWSSPATVAPTINLLNFICPLVSALHLGPLD